VKRYWISLQVTIKIDRDVGELFDDHRTAGSESFDCFRLALTALGVVIFLKASPATLDGEPFCKVLLSRKERAVLVQEARLDTEWGSDHVSDV